MELVAQNVSKRYPIASDGEREAVAVNPTDFLVEGGTFTGIIGRSGSGKSTLLNMLAGLLEPTTGTVELDGIDLYAMDDRNLSQLRNERFGIIPQTASVLANLTVLENVLLPLTLYGHKDAEHHAETTLDLLGIGHLSNHMPDELSGGETRRTAIARALVRKPGIIFADEPTGDLDEENTGIVLTCLRRIADEGAAVVMVTHDDAAASSFVDALFGMDSGTLRKIR